MVRRRHHQPVPQRGGPPPERPRRPGRADLRLHRDRPGEGLFLPRTARRSAAHGGGAEGPGRAEGRPRAGLHADGGRSGVCHAGLRTHRGDPFGGVRRLCVRCAGLAHRRRVAQGDRQRRRRFARRQGGGLQATARRSHPPVFAQAFGGAADRPPARCDGSGRRARPPVDRAARQASACHRALRVGGRHPPQLHALHLRHHRQAQGRAARHRRLRRGTGRVA